jgi:hypothetical protein
VVHLGFWTAILPAWFIPWITPNFGLFQLLGMAFVLGNFFTATADDLDHMASTKGFLKTWTFIVLVVLALDMGDLLWQGYDMEKDMIPFIVKWILLLVFCTLSHVAVGVLFSNATGDVLAMASAGALLSPILIILFFLILKIVDLLERPLLRKFGNGDAYPFMPVVFTSYTIMLLLGLWFGNFI